MAYERGSAADYRALSAVADMPLWFQPWWLDTVAPGQWDVACLISEGRIVAALPYMQRRIRGVKLWTQPKLTPWLGPWLEKRESGPVKRLSWEHAVLAELADAIPRNAVYAQSWSPSNANWLPFYWRGFRETTRYTYRLDLTRGPDSLWRGMSISSRGAIRKATNRYGITVEQSEDVGLLHRLNTATFHRQGISVPHSPEFVRTLYAAAASRGAASIQVARQPDGRVGSAALIVRDATTSYYLMGGADPELRVTGSQNLVIWESICAAATASETFDFEGSMKQPIECTFRDFGGTPTPYFFVSGSHHPWLSSALILREALHHRR